MSDQEWACCKCKKEFNRNDLAEIMWHAAYLCDSCVNEIISDECKWKDRTEEPPKDKRVIFHITEIDSMTIALWDYVGDEGPGWYIPDDREYPLKDWDYWMIAPEPPKGK